MKLLDITAAILLGTSLAGCELVVHAKDDKQADACGKGEQRVVFWTEDETSAPLTTDKFCLIHISFGSRTTLNETACLRAHVQRWSDFPGCPDARLLEHVKEIRPTRKTAEQIKLEEQAAAAAAQPKVEEQAK